MGGMRKVMSEKSLQNDSNGRIEDNRGEEPIFGLYLKQVKSYQVVDPEKLAFKFQWFLASIKQTNINAKPVFNQ